jgi:hypothetical protein
MFGNAPESTMPENTFFLFSPAAALLAFALTDLALAEVHESNE